MKKNMGKLDKILRVLLALSIAILIYFDILKGALAYVLLAVAAVFVLTSLVGFCPLYGIFGIGTCKVKGDSKKS
ncbi:DUF2892 domain-containing protein [Arenibacter sp. GZD96]|uniref:YgaP family membrane protein n=1 Tax=Aurantibrevibacter litoralis TaxID=3106030 RepID=UPI002AFF7374|nr:DUF2892 domain-containing protein [Arenibacter sp. GZD-96]MEA1785827.1 DUF2892 domain-containing protein [Arenibacter sp. GZD-96]